jgi:hypothetical protein
MNYHPLNFARVKIPGLLSHEPLRIIDDGKMIRPEWPKHLEQKYCDNVNDEVD